VAIPISADREKEAEKVALIHLVRAGMPCEVILIIQQDGWSGWVALHNWAVKNLDFDYYCYSCGDYYPGKAYLKMAYEIAIQEGRKLIAFNDGKWGGYIATAGLVEKKWMEKNYDGDLFYSGYKKHYADTELSMIAMEQDVMGYCPDAVLIEIDFEKDNHAYIDKLDQVLFHSRKAQFKRAGLVKDEVLGVFG